MIPGLERLLLFEYVSARPLYEVKNRLLYLLFLVSAGLGHKVFYIIFPPCLHWNLDPFLCRRLVNIWTHKFQFVVGLLVAVVLSVWVCLSRLYTGMHSDLDVICGALISATYPYWETFDRLQLTSLLSPVWALVLAFFLSFTYPVLDHYTTTILGGVLPVPLPALTLGGLALGSARFVVGVVALVATRQMVKTASLWVLCSWYGVSVKDRRQEKEGDGGAV
ncbi:unnamed protein product [Coregonus sp. 'balchen']|nr:unnamed protein product [Coregonus sp. 'balchen']